MRKNKLHPRNEYQIMRHIFVWEGNGENKMTSKYIYAIADKANDIWWKPIMCPSSIIKKNKFEISKHRVSDYFLLKEVYIVPFWNPKVHISFVFQHI